MKLYLIIVLNFSLMGNLPALDYNNRMFGRKNSYLLPAQKTSNQTQTAIALLGLQSQADAQKKEKEKETLYQQQLFQKAQLQKQKAQEAQLREQEARDAQIFLKEQEIKELQEQEIKELQEQKNQEQEARLQQTALEQKKQEEARETIRQEQEARDREAQRQKTILDEIEEQQIKEDQEREAMLREEAQNIVLNENEPDANYPLKGILKKVKLADPGVILSPTISEQRVTFQTYRPTFEEKREALRQALEPETPKEKFNKAQERAQLREERAAQEKKARNEKKQEDLAEWKFYYNEAQAAREKKGGPA